MAWFGVGSGSGRAKPERAQQFEQADRVVVEAFADLHEARRLRSNPAISPGAVQRFERKAWNGLIDYLMRFITQRRLNCRAQPGVPPPVEQGRCVFAIKPKDGDGEARHCTREIRPEAGSPSPSGTAIGLLSRHRQDVIHYG